jgi:hypothetical protein
MGVKITYEGKTYKIGEPTIEQWSKLEFDREYKSDDEFVVDLVASATGLSKDEVLNIKYSQVTELAEYIMHQYEALDDRLHTTIEHEGKKYELTELSELSLGEFIDIDTWLKKTEVQKRNSLSYFMARMYKEVGEEGYDLDKAREREQAFNSLPVKYYLGVSSFFLLLDEILQEPIAPYSLSNLYWRTRRNIRLLRKKILVIFGVGIPLYIRSLKEKLLTSIKSLPYRLSRR